MQGVSSALNACLWLRVSIESAKNHLGLRLDLSKGRLGLLIVDGRTQHKAIQPCDLCGLDHLKLFNLELGGRCRWYSKDSRLVGYVIQSDCGLLTVCFSRGKSSQEAHENDKRCEKSVEDLV